MPGRDGDVFLVDLKRISVSFGSMTEQGLKATFVYGLPEQVLQLLHASS